VLTVATEDQEAARAREDRDRTPAVPARQDKETTEEAHQEVPEGTLRAVAVEVQALRVNRCPIVLQEATEETDLQARFLARPLRTPEAEAVAS
jgi:hypothetical protein